MPKKKKELDQACTEKSVLYLISTAMRLGTRRIDTAGFEVQIEGEQVSR